MFGFIEQYADVFRMIMATILTIAAIGLTLSDPVFGIEVPADRIDMLWVLIGIYGGSDFFSALKAHNGKGEK